MMQGYEMEAAVPFIAAAMRKNGIKLPKEELEAFISSASSAHFAYMQEMDVLTEDGLMGQGEYDEDDAFEAILDMLAANLEIDMDDEDGMNLLAWKLDAFMEAQLAYMERCGLVE